MEFDPMSLASPQPKTSDGVDDHVQLQVFETLKSLVAIFLCPQFCPRSEGEIQKFPCFKCHSGEQTILHLIGGCPMDGWVKAGRGFQILCIFGDPPPNISL